MTHLESTPILATGCSSPAWLFPRSRSHSSNCVSFEKSASTAPAFVPVTIEGAVALGDHANVAVRGISRSRTIVDYVCIVCRMSRGSRGRIRKDTAMLRA